MSSFTQFTGSNVPFGQVLTLFDDRNNPTVDGIEYLKAGALKSITGYSALASNWPSLAVNYATGFTYNSGGVSSQLSVYLTDGTRYYTFNKSTVPTYGTDVTSAWTTSIDGYGSGVNDACRFGTSTTVIFSGTNAIIGYLPNTPTASTVGTAAATVCCASNTAGTLAVALTNLTGAANQIYTSTNGTSWTGQTPSGGTGVPVRATWSPVGNCFIYVNTGGTVYTTTNGYTLTSRGTPVAVVANANQIMQSTYCASSASSTLISITASGSNSYILKTTDGINFTAITPSSIGVPSVGRIQYQNSAYYLFTDVSYGTPSAGVYKSTDEGNTWAAVVKPVIPGATSNIGIDYVAVLNGNIIVTTRSSSAVGVYSVLSTYDTANYIGLPFASTDSIGGSGTAVTSNAYVRIK